MHNVGQHNPLLHHSEACSPHASTSHVTLEAVPAPKRLPPTMSSRTPMVTENCLNSPIHSSPQCPLPPGARHRPLRHHIPLPPTVPGHVELNPLLLSRHEALIRYNLGAPPTTASAFGNNDCWMLEAATRPNLRSMTIDMSDLIPWPIIVYASNINPLVVTVGDVFAAVHDALHTLVTEHEYRLVWLPNVVVGNRYWNGMRRLDLLNGRHWWAGLSKSQEGPEMWNLHLQR